MDATRKSDGDGESIEDPEPHLPNSDAAYTANSLDFEPGAALSGDIIFVYPRSKRPHERFKAFVNVKTQRFLFRVRGGLGVPRKSGGKLDAGDYSHVMLALGAGLVVHADGKKVSIDVISDVLGGSMALRFKVFRRRETSEAVIENVAAAAMRYFFQKYSLRSLIIDPHQRDTTQFCSRLVAHSYHSAGIRLTNLPENRILPLHLLHLFLSDDLWEDVTETFFNKPIPVSIDRLGSFEECGLPGVNSLSEFMKQSDAVQNKAANLSKETKEMFYKSTLKLLRSEALMTQHSVALLKVAKLLYQLPSGVEDTTAQPIQRVLSQIETLLSCSKICSAESLIQDSFLNTQTGEETKSLYAGLPTASEIRKMQIGREEIRIHSYLLLAEIGLFSICAHLTPFEEFEPFRSVKGEYVNRFFKSLRYPPDFEDYAKQEDTFTWVKSAQDRATARALVRHIVAAVGIIDALKKAGQFAKSPQPPQ